MEVQELRIGNLVQLTDQWFVNNHDLYNTPSVVRVDDISKEHLADNVYYVSGYNLSDLEPIPLSDKELVGLGLKKKLSHFYDAYSDIRIESSGEGSIFWLSMKYTVLDKGKSDKTQWNIIAMVKYVHQVQNLYFYLMNQEIKSK